VDCRANVAGSVRRKPAATVSSTARSHLITEPEKFDLTTGARSPDRELPGPFHQPTTSITSISAPRAWPPRRTAQKAPAVQGRGKLAERIEVRIRPFPALHRVAPNAPWLLCPPPWVLFICAKDLFHMTTVRHQGPRQSPPSISRQRLLLVPAAGEGVKSEIIGLANAGGDTINSIKQGSEFGIVRGARSWLGC